MVDLPIARAQATRLPLVPGSSLRGVLRQQVTDGDAELARTLFGPRSISSDQDAFAGALAMGDAHLLVLPVRCLAGVVSFVTCPFILRRYARDLQRAGTAGPDLPSRADRCAKVTPTSVNLVDNKVVLEDLDLPVCKEDPALKPWAERIALAVHPEDADAQEDVVSRFTLVPDDVMSFLAETATEGSRTHPAGPQEGHRQQGALWYEEHLPAETVLWGVFALSNSNNRDDARSVDELARALPGDGVLLQLGGNAGVGQGLVRYLVQGVSA